ncbi:MobP2 family relaxase [Listeria booriae]|uniref:MobP2 family relaxase n=2 Tax=Listeria booriae TaxID=1552123 RepID=UPI00162626B0|nr:MobP2 family relaxase [Listeria booriae]MBC2149717.1 hypothetical protein [Listeria booriae]MBC2324610.1 hypothetical protein [Listeria booriae]
MSSPGVIVKYRYTAASANEFQKYIDYIDRSEAVRKDNVKKYSMFNDYMGNPEKTSALFTQDNDQLNRSEKRIVKEQFEQAQANGSLMWQDVISFDTEFLIKNGIYDKTNELLDDKKLMEVTRNMMGVMLKKEGLDQSAIWTAAIHKNTKHFHIHVATVEPIPTRERGKRTQGTWKASRSKVVNSIMDRSAQEIEITNIIRQGIVGKKKGVPTLHDKDLKKLFLGIYDKLPEDRRKWSYAYNELNHIKPELHQMMDKYLAKYHGTDVKKLDTLLEKESQLKLEAYGSGKYDQNFYKNYKSGKKNDLYQRLGNAFLKEMRMYDKTVMEMEGKRYPSSAANKFDHGRAVNLSLKRMDKLTKKSYESWRNEQAYERLQKAIERDGQGL